MSALKYWNGSNWVAIRPQDSLSSLTTNGYLLSEAYASCGAGNAASTGIWPNAGSGGATGMNSGTISTVPPEGWFHWDPADYPAPPAGWVRKWLQVGKLVHSSTVGTITYTIGTRRFTVGGNNTGISYSMIGGDTEARVINFVNPTGGQSLPAPTLIDPTALGHYGVYIAWNATTAAGAFATMSLRTYLVYVPG